MSTSDDYPQQNVPPAPGSPPPGYQQPGAAAPGGYGAPSAGGPAPEALAGFWIRFLGALVDAILIGIVSGVVQAIVTGGAAVGFVVAGAYFTYLHATPAGQTIGNLAVGIRIVDRETGASLDYVRALLRWLMSYVSGFALLIGYLWMLWDPDNQTWHDKVANSLVVRASHYPPPAPFGKPASSA